MSFAVFPLINPSLMKKPKQMSFIKDPRKDTKLWWIVKQGIYGGSLDYRKVKRPFDSKRLVHAVFKGNPGTQLRFTKSVVSIRKLATKVAMKSQVKMKDIAVNHDHLHILIQAQKREQLTAFLKTLAAEMGKMYQRLAKKYGVKRKGSLWVKRPFTRLVNWERLSREKLKKYFEKNRKEALGFIEYQPRKHRLSEFLARWERMHRVADDKDLKPIAVNTA